MNEELRRLVWSRAASTCEYCRMVQMFDPLPFGIDHIRPQYHHGLSISENLCLACFQCNTFKAVNIAGFDPETDQLSELFHPRRHVWNEQFVFLQGRIEGQTIIGRTTVDVLRINLPERVEHRRLLVASGFNLA